MKTGDENPTASTPEELAVFLARGFAACHDLPGAERLQAQLRVLNDMFHHALGSGDGAVPISTFTYKWRCACRTSVAARWRQYVAIPKNNDEQTGKKEMDHKEHDAHNEPISLSPWEMEQREDG